MADFLDEKRKEIQARLKELKPAGGRVPPPRGRRAALSGVGNGTPAAAAARHARAARRGARRRLGNGRRGRPRGSGTRGAAGARAGAARPGITIPELAEAMGIKQNYLYRVMPGLAEEGKVTKSGRGWHVRDGA